jgi:lipopolysaccharide/colanic/teichoic acid biosynthesis glycosyltransferase
MNAAKQISELEANASYSRPERDVLTPDEFRRVLDGERARSDRSEEQFSVLVLDGDALHDIAGREAVICCLNQRLRITDQIGWLAADRLALLLPQTRPSGAQKLAGDICALSGRPLQITLYTYPGAWLPEDPSGSGLQNGGRLNFNDAAVCARPPEELFDHGMPPWKRAMDIAGAMLGLIVLAPVFLIVAITIMIVSPGPVFLRQKRVGYQGRLFTIWKFRTMKPDADISIHQEHFQALMAEDVPLTKLDVKGDPRIIPLGNLMRRLCLDELPQLINVLRGDMSLVGPRPCLAFAVSQYRPWQRMRCDAFPGMTGLWQVSGKNKTTFKQMIRLDIAYARHKSPAFDVSILLKTIPAIIRDAAAAVSAGLKKVRTEVK